MSSTAPSSTPLFLHVTRFEKILLLFLGLMSGACLAAGSSGFLTLSFWPLAVSYGLGAYWLFRAAPLAPAGWVRVVAGLCLGAALLEVNNGIRLRHGSYEQATPALLGLLCLGLSTYVFVNRAAPQRVRAYRPLLVRAATVFVFCAFFAYCPLTVPFCRQVLLLLNVDKPKLTANLRMFAAVQRTEEALDDRNGDAAVRYAYQACAAGNHWLGADSVRRRYQISGTYTNLYKAYRCQADTAYQLGQYAAALRSYQRGHYFLLGAPPAPKAAPTSPTPWEAEEVAWSLNNQAYCQLKLHRLAQSDSLFLAALKTYSQVKPRVDTTLARFESDLASSQAAGQHWASSTWFYQRANQLLGPYQKRTVQAAKAANTLAWSINYVNQDSLPQALQWLRTLHFAASDSADQYKAGLYEGICYYKQSLYRRADSLFRRSQSYYQAHPTQWALRCTTELLLAKTCLARGQYLQAQARATTARAVVARHRGDESSKQARCLEVLAAVNRALGHYDEAAQQFTQVLSVYQRGGPRNATSVAGVLEQLATVDITQGNLAAAQVHSAAALALVREKGTLQYASQTELLNTAAYVAYAGGHYQSARGQYQESVTLNRRFGLSHGLATASAWNGWGLVELAQQHLDKADSLLAAATTLYLSVLGEAHPLTANVYLNEALLRAQQHRFPEALLLLQKVRQIAAATLPADHDLFGDLAAAQGDVAQQQGQFAPARSYYQQALEIYAHKFGGAHWKVQEVKHKLETKTRK